MSQAAAIKAAVWAQLSADDKPLPTTGQEVMGADYKYDTPTMRNFLMGIHNLLAADKPPLAFQWTNLNTDTCLKDTVMTLCGYISSEIS